LSCISIHEWSINKEHPLVLVPNSGVAALLEAYEGIDDRRTHALIDAYLEQNRPKFLRFFEKNVRAAATPYTAANLSTWNVTLGDLLKAVPELTLDMIGHYGLVKTADDLTRLGIESLQDLVAIAPPRRWKLMSKAIQEHDNIELTTMDWLQELGKWRPRDLNVLGVNLEMWFANHPKVRQAALQKQGEWLLKRDAQGKLKVKLEHWVRYAGLPQADMPKQQQQQKTATTRAYSTSETSLL